MSRNSVNPKRLHGLTWLAMAMFAVAGLSQARVQVFQKDEILERATKTDRFLVSRTEFAKRGQLLDREGRPLAQDEDTRYLTIQFEKTPKTPAFYMDLAAATGIPATEFATLAETAKAPVDWKRPIAPAQAAAVLDVKQRWRADGVGLSRSGRRAYALGEAASGLIGAMREKTALSGIELGYNQTLAGSDGKIVGIVDREGNYLPMRLDRQTVRRQDGATLTLTLDSDIQQAAAEAVRRAVDSNKADQGVAIVMDPKTGDVLAMANWPSFDPNRPIEPSKNQRTPEFNGAYMAALEPGSTFKVLTLAKALDEGVIQQDDTYYCKGSIQIRNRVMSCDRHHGSSAHGLLDPEQAIARSCNLAAANWARKVGHGDFVHFMEQLGLMEKPGLKLPRESRGLYNYNDYTKDVQLATNGFGQSMNYTPLSLTAAFCMLGNDGKRVRPRLIFKKDDEELAIPAGEQVIAPETASQVLTIMRAVFESDRGTAKSLRIPGYVLGGKTGTAQKKNFQTGDMKGGGYVSNFVGFVPAEQPKAVILVMIDNPKAGQYYGASVAGPVFKSVAQSVIRKMHLPKATNERTASRVLAEEPASEEPEIKRPAPRVEEPETMVVPKPRGEVKTQTLRRPRVEVASKALSPAVSPRKIAAKRVQDRTNEAEAKAPRKRVAPKIQVEERRTEVAPKRSSAKRPAQRAAPKQSSISTTPKKQPAATVRVENPKPRVTKSKVDVKAPATTKKRMSVAPKIDELRKVGAQAEKVHQATSKKARSLPKFDPVTPASKPGTTKPKAATKPKTTAPSTRTIRKAAVTTQGKVKPKPTQSPVSKKRSTSDRVNR